MKEIIAIDVSKHHIDVYDSKSQRHERLPADTIQSWIKTIRSRKNILVVMEATGIYSKRLQRALQDHEISVSVVNPRYIRRYAQACGILAKTDKIDARIIAEYAISCSPKETEKLDDSLIKLQSLVKRRQQLNTSIIEEKCHLESCEDYEMEEIIMQHIDFLKDQMKVMEKSIEQLIENTGSLNEKARIITSMPGAGKVLAATLIAEMPELGTLDRNEIAALSGLAPFNRDSGNLRGRRSIYGGRTNVRKVLYMVALVAKQCNPWAKNIYQNLSDNGKPFKVAITALMRKIIIALNSMLKHNQMWKA